MSKEKIEFEQVTLKVPKAVMEYLRRIYGDPVKWLEYEAVDQVRADLDAMSGRNLADIFGLEPVFETVLEEAEAK